MVNEMHKKRILFVITKSVWGGAQKYVYDLAVNLPRENFDVLVAAGGEGIFAGKIKQAGIKYLKIKNFQKDINFVSDIFAFFEVLKLLCKEKPDIIHSNSSKAAGIVGIAILIYKMFFRVLHPILHTLNSIFTVHGWAFNEIRPRWQIFLIKLASRLTCAFYDKIICVSEFDRRAAIKNKIAPARKFVTVHNGIALDEGVFLSKEEARKYLKSQIPHPAGGREKGENSNSQNILIGTVGEFTKNKGQEYLINALLAKPDLASKVAVSNSIPYTLYLIPYILILGWGEDKQKLEEKIKELKLENQIFLIEGVSLATPYLKAFDIFVLPSIKEGLPYTLLEAGLAKIPVIASEVGGIPEIIENEKTGLLTSPVDVSALASAIKKLMEDKNLREKLAENLRQKIISEFSLEKMVRETLKIYK